MVTPYECLHKSKPNLAGVPEWGQCVWVHNDSGSKLDAWATVAHWVGYNADSTHAHRIYWPQKRSVSVKCNVKFTSDARTIPISIPHITMGTMPAPPIPAQITHAPLHPPPEPMPAPAQVTSPPPWPLPAASSSEEEMDDEEVDSQLQATPVVTGWLAQGQENCQRGWVSAFDPQDWWSSLGLGLVRYCSDSWLILVVHILGSQHDW